MKVLVSGNLGYVGSALTSYLTKSPTPFRVLGFDTGFFAHCLTGTNLSPEIGLEAQTYGDVREIDERHLDGVDAIVHLAAISNDPIGNQFESATNDINRVASVRLAELAFRAGVKNFVFASSCSMYGASSDGARTETDATNPLTAYAKSKIGVEEDVQKLDLGDTVFTSLRFATACGWSPRIRLDLVLNDFVACALGGNEISVLSDGTPWRPLIDVEDMCRAIEWATQRPLENGGQFLAVNVGHNAGNYRVIDLASEVVSQIDGASVAISPEGLPDPRSYKVDFSLFESLAPHHQPAVSLQMSIARLIAGLSSFEYDRDNFRNSGLMRLNVLRQHMSNDVLSQELRWNTAQNP